VDEGRLKDGALLGLALGACAYAVQYYLLYGVELLLVATTVLGRRVFRPAPLRALAVGAACTLGLTAPLIQVFLSADVNAPTPFDGFELFSGDLLSFVVPSFTHPMLAAPLAPLHARLVPGAILLPQEKTMFVGWTLLALAAAGFARWRREGRPLALVTAIVAVFFVLSLGSHLKIAGESTGLPLPAMILGHVPVLDHARAPGRHVVLVLLGLGILAGAAWSAIPRRWPKAALALLLAFEYLAAPFPLTSTAISPAHQRLAQVPGDYAVLDLPLQVRDGHHLLGSLQTEQMLGQTAHGRPIVGGMVSRQPDAVRRRIQETPIIGSLLHPQGVTREAMERDTGEGPNFFLRHRIFAIVVQRPAVGSLQQRYLHQVLPVVRHERAADGALIYWLRDPEALRAGQ
jgi:hypothetical protein